MIWASLAAANKRDPPISSVVLLVLAAGAVPGTAFYLALRARQRHGRDGHGRTPLGRSRQRHGGRVVAAGGCRRCSARAA
jgi:hypothetical protein